MKNLIIVTDKDEIHDFMMGMWKTDFFRESHRNHGIVYDVVEHFAWLPRIFAEASNDTLERPHFSTWWGVMMIRDDYPNPIIHDLYWLHEMYHAGHMPYVANIGEAAFDEKMQRNELEASVLSEIQIYFEIPGLREVSFPHPIYADRFLTDPVMKMMWKNNREVAIETIRSIRRDVMTSKPVHLMDRTEEWIRRFSEQNSIFSLTWSDRYREVEQHMVDFQFAAAWNREEAVRWHLDWITTEANRDPVDNIPFRQEAELFSPYYWANKEKYNRAMAA